MTTIVRETKETKVTVEIALGKGTTKVDTGLPFFDHMLSTFARYAGLDLTLHARGDLRHHLMEDVAITLGAAVQKVIPATAARYGERTIPMDDALVQACIDVGGRFYYRGPLRNKLYEHVMRSFCEHARVTLHLRILRGKDSHHVTEAAFKALGMALRDAMVDSGVVFSTKGAVALEVK
ncbi:imidazoleglycerol-phosphate dehydratase [Archangium violaceum]|jgi:imidazoleglycerol-phosphate dehydratase|uniref:imidazoleglycerol-phosphate dehydratase n=1 Tax=Archangium violaceum TaxID=83451 RepID=UPI001951AB9F|nr:imidazoleglycerol-phosphate dehydratase [Archangium violaceum]QRN93481.1 imidazoleglycerol-phosphate dehydratase [Archangium violaceum]